MNVMMISSLNTYTTNMKMQMKWKEKQASGNYASGTKTAEEQLKESALDAAKSQNSASSQMMQTIQAKMMGGKKLSAEEMAYLKEHAPETYQKARAIEMEREAYERELKQCKTKKEVQRVKMAHAASAMASVKEIESNPNIPKGKKLELMMQELQRSQALGDTERKYVESGEYKRLPTEAERLKAEKEMEEAKKAEMGIEDPMDDTAKETAQKAVEEAAEEAEGTEENGMGTEEWGMAGSLEPSLSRHAVNKPDIDSTERAEAILARREMSRMEAEVTPEARKVRRAKAQAAYAKNSYTGGQMVSVDIKVE